MNNITSFDFSIHAPDLKVILTLFATLVSFITYWFISQSQKIKAFYFKKYTQSNASLKHIFFVKSTGFLLMGVLPLVLSFAVFDGTSFESLGFIIKRDKLFFTILCCILLSLLIIPLVIISAKKEKNLINYPQARILVWTKSSLINYLFGWFIYLLGYEFLFRGFLFLILIEPLGLWQAMAINVTLYSATHIPKGLDETIGAIPLGIVLCILTAISGNIWIAFVVHVIMAWTNSLTALKASKEMRFE